MTKEVYNLIILDRSGSMSTIASQAIAGVNETVGSIRAAQKKTGMTQYVSIVSFCGCSTKYFCTNAPVEQVKTMTANDYEPCCSTPLYDAMGAALTNLRKNVSGKQDVAVSVTIITDGYENASTEWNGATIKALVEMLKADGWLFAYIGANQDVEAVSFKLSIDHSMAFEATSSGTKKMFAKERKARESWNDRVCCCERAADANIGYFSDDAK